MIGKHVKFFDVDLQHEPGNERAAVVIGKGEMPGTWDLAVYMNRWDRRQFDEPVRRYENVVVYDKYTRTGRDRENHKAGEKWLGRFGAVEVFPAPAPKAEDEAKPAAPPAQKPATRETAKV